MENVFFASLDYEKAFDTVHREFLNKCLNHFGFPNYFKEWISIMYTDIESCISNNGFTTPYYYVVECMMGMQCSYTNSRHY